MALRKVSRVKDQGNGCGSSWAFSAVSAVESALMISDITNATLSEQQIIDCTADYDNFGCNGGWMNNTFKYIIDKGIVTEEKYPYVGKTQQCKVDGGPFKINAYTDLSGCDNLVSSLKFGPPSVIADASNWFSYQSGIFNACGTIANHAVLVVAYHEGYWTVKNSWGNKWGESGFIRLAPGNTCQICWFISVPIII